MRVAEGETMYRDLPREMLRSQPVSTRAQRDTLGWSPRSPRRSPGAVSMRVQVTAVSGLSLQKGTPRTAADRRDRAGTGPRSVYCSLYFAWAELTSCSRGSPCWSDMGVGTAARLWAPADRHPGSPRGVTSGAPRSDMRGPRGVTPGPLPRSAARRAGGARARPLCPAARPDTPAPVSTLQERMLPCAVVPARGPGG